MQRYRQFDLVVFCGYPGSGKSTLSSALAHYFPQRVIRVNQDELRSRQHCENYLMRALRATSQINQKQLDMPLLVVIDRTNFDWKQRKTWIDMGNAFGAKSIQCLYMDIPVDICKERVFTRHDHPTGVHGEHGIEIMGHFLRNFKEPQSCEGFHRVFRFSDTPIQEILNSSEMATNGEFRFTLDQTERLLTLFTSPCLITQQHGPQICRMFCYFVSRRHPEWMEWQERFDTLWHRDCGHAVGREDVM